MLLKTQITSKPQSENTNSTSSCCMWNAFSYLKLFHTSTNLVLSYRSVENTIIARLHPNKSKLLNLNLIFFLKKVTSLLLIYLLCPPSLSICLSVSNARGRFSVCFLQKTSFSMVMDVSLALFTRKREQCLRLNFFLDKIRLAYFFPSKLLKVCQV